MPGGEPQEIAWAIRERCERFGIDEVVVPVGMADDFGAVLPRLSRT